MRYHSWQGAEKVHMREGTKIKAVVLLDYFFTGDDVGMSIAAELLQALRECL